MNFFFYPYRHDKFNNYYINNFKKEKKIITININFIFLN